MRTRIHAYVRVYAFDPIGKIQCSEEIYNTCVEKGLSDCLEEREGGIDAKGKGKLKSYWVIPDKVLASSTVSVRDAKSAGL